jgi:hypothetical protein
MENPNSNSMPTLTVTAEPSIGLPYVKVMATTSRTVTITPVIEPVKVPEKKKSLGRRIIEVFSAPQPAIEIPVDIPVYKEIPVQPAPDSTLRDIQIDISAIHAKLDELLAIAKTPWYVSAWKWLTDLW